jgi:hypothetical protein
MKTKNKRKKVAEGSVETESDAVPKKYRGSYGSKTPLNQKFEPVNIPGPADTKSVVEQIIKKSSEAPSEGQWIQNSDGNMIWRDNAQLCALIKEEL